MLLLHSSIVLAIDVKTSAPQRYTVEKGDTLWDIAGIYLDKPWQWPDLWRNNVHIQNPHLIYPGDVISLRYNERGEPELVLDVSGRDKPVIHLQPSVKKDKKQGQSIPLLSWSLVQSYIENDLIMPLDEYEKLPYVLGNQDGAVRFASGDLILGRYEPHYEVNLYRIVRMEGVIVDDDDESLGVKVRHVADAELLNVGLDREMLVNVVDANFEVKRGDKLLPITEMIPDEVVSFTSATEQVGKIVSSLHPHTLLGKYDVVVLDLGESEVKRGMVMGIYMQGPDIIAESPPSYKNDRGLQPPIWGNIVSQPALKVGELIVFKTFEKTSFALIASATRIVRNGAIVAKP
ncbi:LysM peptidoglycan-binding domain-containing protein [Alteromonas sp. a30]|nr:LysM peptidoglycan-binding domain-containing protein [Alteromonas sp. a30]